MPTHAPAYATEVRPKTAGGTGVPPAISGSVAIWSTALHDVGA